MYHFLSSFLLYVHSQYPSKYIQFFREHCSKKSFSNIQVRLKSSFHLFFLPLSKNCYRTTNSWLFTLPFKEFLLAHKYYEVGPRLSCSQLYLQCPRKYLAHSVWRMGGWMDGRMNEWILNQHIFSKFHCDFAMLPSRGKKVPAATW